MNQSIPAIQLQRFPLPRISSTGTGPLHSVAVAPGGTIYYCDEINHTVAGLGDKGSLLWHRSEKGSAPGQFFYPKGLSIGKIATPGNRIECLAVCDSSNRRVQFLDFDGRVISIWTSVGDFQFSEVVDIRFIAGGDGFKSTTGSSGYWLVLDNGSHKIWALDESGNLRFQAGRCFPPGLEACWAAPGVFLESQMPRSGVSQSFPPFDFLFFPTRLLGDAEDSLYVWQPHAGSLKQVLPPNLVPIHLGSGGLEWISADESGIVGWDTDNNRLVRYGFDGELQLETMIQGSPVPSSLSPDKYFLQNGEFLELWRWAGLQSKKTSRSRSASLLRRSASIEAERTDFAEAQKTCFVWAKLIEDALAIVDRVLSMTNTESTAEILKREMDSIRQLSEWRANAQGSFSRTLHHWCLALLEFHLSGCAEQDCPAQFKQSYDRFAEIAAQVRNTSSETRLRTNSAAECRQVAHPNPEKSEHFILSWRDAVAIIEADLHKSLCWINSQARL